MRAARDLLGAGAALFGGRRLRPRMRARKQRGTAGPAFSRRADHRARHVGGDARPCADTCAGARFVNQDIADWTPEDSADLIFANGALQFLPDHDALFPRLASMLGPWRGVRSADAVGRARIVACADADGGGRGPVVVAAGAGREVAAADRRLRELLRMASTRSLPHRIVVHDICLRLRRRGRHCRLVRRARRCSPSWNGCRTMSDARSSTAIARSCAAPIRFARTARCCSPIRACSLSPRED